MIKSDLIAGCSWRDRVQVHPAAEMFPMMSNAELAALVVDIENHGLKHPLVFYCDRTKRSSRDYPRDDELLLLDGRNRLEAMSLAGITLFDDDGRFQPDAMVSTGDGDPITIIWRSLGGSEDFDPFAYVMSTNLHRRHLTPEQRRELVNKLLTAKPERSNRATATLANVDHKTVAAVRARKEARGEIPHLETRTGANGHQQPVAKRKLGSHARTLSRTEVEKIRAEAPREEPRTGAPAPVSIVGAWEDVFDRVKALAPDQFIEFMSAFLSYIGAKHDVGTPAPAERSAVDRAA